MVSCDETTYHSQSQPYLDSSTYQQHQQNFQYGGLGPRGGVDGGEQLWFRTMKRRKVLSGPADIRGPNDHTQEHNTPRNTAYDDVEWNYDIQE